MHEAIARLKHELQVVMPDVLRVYLESAIRENDFDCVDEVLVNTLQHRIQLSAQGDPCWRASFVAIGDDGCGNTVFLDTAAGESGELQLFAYDPPGIERPYRPYGLEPATLSYVRKPSEREGARPFPGIWISRHKTPWKAILSPITLVEWESVAQNDPSITVRNYRETINPFTNESLRIAHPGFTVWQTTSGNEVEFQYWYGALATTALSPEVEAKTTVIANHLDANVIVIRDDQRG